MTLYLMTPKKINTYLTLYEGYIDKVMIPFDFHVTWSKVKVKLLVFISVKYLQISSLILHQGPAD